MIVKYVIRERSVLGVLSFFKNFSVTFLVSVVVFALIAYFSMNIVQNVMAKGHGIVTDPATGTSENDTGDDADLLYKYVTDDSGNIVTDESGSAVTEIVDIDSDPTNVVDGKSFNVLFIGTDYQPDILSDYDLSEYNSEVVGFKVKERRFCTDTLILMHVDKEQKSFVFTAIPANTRVMVGGGTVAIGSLCTDYGVDFLCDKITALTGLNIDYHVSMKISDCVSLINTLGGIEFDVPIDMNYVDETQQLEINLKAGLQTLNGENALEMLRYNGYANGNISRMEIGIKFVKALFEKMTASEYFAKAPGIFSSISYCLETNFTVEDFTSHLELIFAYPEYQAVEIQYPGTTVSYEGGHYFEPDVLSATEVFRQFRH